MGFIIRRPPVTPEELWELVVTMWGVRIPRMRVCPGHSAPFDAFCEGYFGNAANWALWYGSRGTGKSLMLAILGITRTVVLDTNTILLGGSMAQSQNVHEHIERLMRSENAPVASVARQIKTELLFQRGNWVRPIPASQTTARGPHPHTTLLDEIDEMEKAIYDAAQGQALRQPNMLGLVVPEMTVASSTWQHPLGCLIVGTMVTTSEGDRPIETIKRGDAVLTRDGYRFVTGSHNMAMQPYYRVKFASGRHIMCTPWHPVWIESRGFVRADQLLPGLVAAVAVPEAGSAPQVLVSTDADPLGDVAVDAGASGLAVGSADLSGPSVVLGEAHRFEVLGVDAGLDPAQVVDDVSIGDGADTQLVHPPVGEVGALSDAGSPLVLQAVATVVDGQRPDDAVVGVQVDGHTFEPDEVVEVISHADTLVPTWDLTVEGTHEYVANGVLVHNTFQEVRDHALLEGLPIHTWCWREVVKSPENPDGWMDPAFIENKRRSVGREMFRVEYELGEPRGGSRALDPDLVEKFFVDMVPVRESHRANDDEWVYAEPEVNGTYVAGADWAKETDKTSITVFRTDLDPAPLVYQRTLNRRSWPEMVKLFNATVTRYHAMSGHDATGVGNVVNDMVDSRVLKVLMVDQKRRDLLNEYVSDFESGRYRLPRGTPIHNMHKATTMAMVWAGAAGAGVHLPDEFASAAIANRARRRMPPPVGGSDVPKGSNPAPAKSLRPVSTSPSMRPMGDVVQYEDDDDIAVFSFG